MKSQVGAQGTKRSLEGMERESVDEFLSFFKLWNFIVF